MDSFDKRILSVFRDETPRDFRQLLRDTFCKLERQDFIVKKKPSKAVEDHFSYARKLSGNTKPKTAIKSQKRNKNHF